MSNSAIDNSNSSDKKDISLCHDGVNESSNSDTQINKKEENNEVISENIKSSIVTNEIKSEISGENTSCNNNSAIDLEKKRESSDYEVVNGVYYYTDSSGQRYYFSNESNSWEKDDESGIRTDEEGRQYYTADGMYLCRNPDGSVFYMDEKQDWTPWESHTSQSNEKQEESERDKWYFHQGGEAFYRNNATNKVYKFDKDTNQWEEYKGKLKRKRKRSNDIEEFDSDEEELEEDLDEEENSIAPPGFKTDPAIQYDGNIYTKVDTDNVAYEWDTERKAWFPKLDENFMASYQMSYGFKPDGTKDENPLKFDDEEEEEEEEEEKKEVKKKPEKKKAEWFTVDDAHNTKVYVSNLPSTTTQEQFVDLMQKCGLVLKEFKTGHYKVKLYKDDEGNFKGDALCHYIKVESVSLALQVLDGSRIGNNTIKVQRAQFSMKGSYDPSKKPRKRNKKEIEKQMKKQEKLFDWRPEPTRGARGKHENVIIIRNAFDTKEFVDDAERLLMHQETLRAQCESFGNVKKLQLFDRHPDGVVQIAFADVEAADLCRVSMHGRLYRGRTLQLNAWDGKENFSVEESEEERQERLKKWDEFLEGKSES